VKCNPAKCSKENAGRSNLSLLLLAEVQDRNAFLSTGEQVKTAEGRKHGLHGKQQTTRSMSYSSLGLKMDPRKSALCGEGRCDWADERTSNEVGS
jgi:hypothetical protein